jgi:alpha,alpha-trehalase
MKNKITLALTVICIGLFACKQDSNKVAPSANSAQTTAQGAATSALPLSPDKAYGPLFHAVQMARIFPDGKTFVDCTPKRSQESIVSSYLSESRRSGFDLKAFVTQNFDTPATAVADYKSDLNMSVTEHINQLWPILTRQADQNSKGTLIPLPSNYVVPGGRFREVYYWDSYFTMLGLQVAGQEALITSMCDNFKHLIETVGHIPNGNRSYYLGRSQPPFYSLMIRLMQTHAKTPEEGNAILIKYLPSMVKEHEFWMRGASTLTENYTATERVVRFPDGIILNRYWDNIPGPRPESYREDVETIRLSGRDSVEMCRHLRAGAESGWDYSSRWGANNTLKDIVTADIVPVDLNCLLYHLEQIISEAYVAAGDQTKAQLYGQKAYYRRLAIHQIFYEKQASYYMDFDFNNKNRTGILSLAGMYPLFFDIQPTTENKAIAQVVEKNFLKPGGVVTTNNHTGQQWDAPNGWAPLQYITIIGLRNAKANKLADQIKERWLSVNENVFKRTGKMLEKYNVESINLESGGGEYPVQDGFGWTNGVYLALKSEKK